jgi:hypothetical protein
MSLKEYKVERISKATLHFLEKLLSDVYGRNISVKYLEQKFNTAAFGAEYIGFLAFDHNYMAVAYYGVLPYPFSIGGKAVLAAQSCDSVTHSNHRKKGLFTMLATKTFELARENNIKFIFGFPNQNSLPGFKKLGWTFFENGLKYFYINTGIPPFSKILKKISWIDNRYNHYLSKYFSRFPGIKQFPTITDGVQRTEYFINYKTFSKSFLISLKGNLAWLKVDKELSVGHLVFKGSHADETVIPELKKIARHLGCSQILFITNTNSDIYKLLHSKYPLSEGEAFPVGFLNLGIEETDVSQINFEFCDIDIF